MTISTPTNLDYLIENVRLLIGDTDPSKYRYTDDWIRTSLVASVKSLMNWWGKRYLVDESYNVYRNTYVTFDFQEPPIIQYADEYPIVLNTAIIILGGSLENSAWDIVSWKDNEISFSNLESGRIRNDRLKSLQARLLDYLTPPTKKLARARSHPLPGYKTGNDYERDQSEPI